MNILTIYLDARLNATLDFQKEKELAREAVLNGSRLIFEIDFGLFSNLTKSLSHSSQCLSFKLSLDHFKNFIFEEFQDHIEEICLYKGLLNFSNDALFDDELLLNFKEWQKERAINVDDIWSRALFCRDVFVEYLQIITENMPDSMLFSLWLGCKTVTDPLFYALLTQREVYQRLHLKLIDNPHAHDTSSRFAICLPSKDIVSKSDYEGLEPVFQLFQENNASYRLIPESMLITEWDLVDYLFVLSHTIKQKGKRKLQGFAAAGGIVVAIGEKIGIDGEISFPEFLLLNHTN